MKRGTKIGLALVAFSIILSVWVLAGGTSKADQPVGDFTLTDDLTTIVSYDGAGGDVVIPDTVTSIPNTIFKDDTKGIDKKSAITSVTIPASVETISAGAFSECTNLKTVTFATGNKIEEIVPNCFYNCSSLSGINLPSSVRKIGSNAFANCKALTSFTVPSSCDDIASDALSGCSNIGNILVEQGNGFYAMSNGCLYNASMTRLCMVPEGKTKVTVPVTVTTVADDAISEETASSTYVAKKGEQNSAENVKLNTSGVEGLESKQTDDNTYIGEAIDDTDVVEESGEGEVVENVQPNDTQSIYNPNFNWEEYYNQMNGTTTNGQAANTDKANHEKDQTPTTADGDIDPKFGFCMAALLAGIGVLLFARSKKSNVISQNSNRR